MRTLVLAAALALAPLGGQAKTVVVLSAELGPYQEALAGVKEVVPDASSVTLQDGKADVSGADVVIALGGQAAMADYPDSARLVVAMVADAKLKPAHANVRISMLPLAASLFAKMKALQPSLSSIAAFGVESSYDAYLHDLGAAAQAGGVSVDVHKVNKVADLVAALRSITGKDQALWVAPDPVLVSQETFKLMNEFCLANKIGLYAPAASLAKTGALAGVAPTFKEIGKAAGRAAAGGANSGSVSPEKSEVMVNVGTAGSLGLSIPAGFTKVGQ